MTGDELTPARAFRLVGRVLYDIAHALSSAEHAEPRLRTALEWLRQIVPYDRCALLVDQASAPARLIVAPDAPPAEHAALAAAVSRLFRLVSESAEAAAVPPDVAGSLPYRSHLAVPVVGLEVIGVLFVGRAVPDGYHEEDLTLLSVVASQLGAYLTALRLDAENRHLYDEARAASAAKDDFLITLSHELRTPLNAVIGWIRMLRTGSHQPERVQHALEVVDRNSRTLSQLLDDLLDVSRIVSGKLRLETRLFHLHPVIEAAVDAVRDSAEKKGVEIRSALDRSVGPILGDPDRVQQVIWNLLSNAIKFTPAGRGITLDLQRAGEFAQLRVTDAGDGIAPDLLPFVFDRFRQGRLPATPTAGGLGIGLSIVHHLVELHGGRVKADSKGEGHGATFTVWLPLYAAGASPPGLTPPAAPVESTADERPRLDGLTILLVEDEADNREMLSEALTRAGARVVATPSVSEALEAVTQSRPDVIVSDITLPDEDGYHLIRDIRSRPDDVSRVAAVALTGRARREDATLAAEAGFDVHLAKPIDPIALCATIARVANNRRPQPP
jgi:signal transduction histidine kinase/ActR/RegA family two-component response regulator